MKKFFLLTMASMMTVFAMAIGRNDGSTKANAIDFDWDKGVEHSEGTKWYRVDLAPLYQEDNPSLTLYLTNPSNWVGTSVDVSMTAYVAGQTESKSYSIAAHQYKTYTANASMLVRMKQTEIYLTLTTDGKVKLSAKVFETADLDETCRDARVLKWDTETSQNPSFSAWWKVDLTPVKNASNKDAKITLTNTGLQTVNLKVGQSLDCPSSGTTRRDFVLAPGESILDTIPRDMILNVQPDELYFGIENLESQVSIKVELVDQPLQPVIPVSSYEELHVESDFVITAGTHLYRISVAEMRDTAKYEPEFTYRNEGTETANVSVKMAFKLPAYGTSNTDYVLGAGEEEIVVYKKNMLDGLDESVHYIYLLTETDQDVHFYGRFKHVREGKACKTNIDFNWEDGHTQEARTTVWYAIDVADARDNIQDIVVHLINLGASSAKVKAELAFSCPYIDLQEVTRTIAADGKEVSRVLGYSSYAMMSDTVWIGITTNQDIKFWATTKPAKTKAADDACLTAVKFDWDNGARQNANDTVWYKIAMAEARDKSAKFPTVFVQNLSADASAKIEAELSLECPDSIANEKRSLTIAANGSYTRTLSRNMFENIAQDTIYLRVISTQDVVLQIRLTEEAAGTSCSSAVPFNWVSGNTQAADADVWYAIDLRDVMNSSDDVRIKIENKDNASCKGVAQLVYSCPMNEAPSIQDFSLASKGSRSITLQNSVFETLSDSIVYVNLQATTSVHIEATRIPQTEPFDTIYADGLTLIPIQWDSLYTQNTDTAWYIIPQSEIDLVRNMEEKQKPIAHLINTTNAKMTVKAEAAFAFPIVKKMMTKSQDLKANQHYQDTVPAGTFEQFLKKDSIILRVTRPAGTGAFQFCAELVKANTGNTRYDAEPLTIGKHVEQEANTSMWYRINTADLKSDPNLFNKRLNVWTGNYSSLSAEITVAVYEGLSSQEDLLEKYGLEDYRKRKVPGNEKRSKSFPAQVLYAVGDIDLYINVTTTRHIGFTTKFDGEYAPITPDPNQQKAKLLVPNVDYIIPGDNQEHWYLVCFPYIRNNYKYIHDASLAYALNGTATIEATATLQDEMNCNMPVRKRVINKKGGNFVGTKPLSEILAKGVNKLTGRNFDLTTFQEGFIDESLRRYISSDSLTGYVRIKSDKDIMVRINMPQTTGDAMRNPMMFDWEHGNVNPENQQTWYRAEITPDRVPEGKDLRLHVTNWSDQSCVATAKIYLDTLSTPKSKSYTLAPNEDKWHDIGRAVLAGSSDLLIDYHSDYTTHIWAEIIDARPRDSIVVDTTLLACDGDLLTDPYTGVTWTVDVNDPATMLIRDSIPFINDTALAEWDSICYIHVVQRVNPTIIELPDIPAVDQVVIKKGQPIDYAAADAWLQTQFADERTIAPYYDTIAIVSEIIWERSINDANDEFEPIDPTAPISDEAQVIRYQIVTECKDTIPSNLFYNPVRDTLIEEACKEYHWVVKNPAGYVVKDSTYTVSTLDSAQLKTANFCDHVMYLDLTILDPVHGDTLPVSACKKYHWVENDQTGKTVIDSICSIAGVYVDTIPGGASNGCDSIVAIDLSFLPDETKSMNKEACFFYEWSLSDLDTIIYDGGTYTHKIVAGEYDCDTVVTLTLKIEGKYSTTLKMYSKYGDRLLMIDRRDINENMPGWRLEEDETDLVQWYKVSTPKDIFLGYGFYYTKSDGSVLDAGTYYATVELPASEGAKCGARGETNHWVVKGASPAPALMPSLARPGEDIRVVNLNPEEQTTIRVYTTEGLNKGSYTVRGEESFTLKAGYEHGFYLVEIVSENDKSTLRYIVK